MNRIPDDPMLIRCRSVALVELSQVKAFEGLPARIERLEINERVSLKVLNLKSINLDIHWMLFNGY